MMLATIQLIADAAAASNTFDASGVAQLVIGLVGGGAVAGGSYALGRRTTVTNDPLHCREVKELVTRDKHDEDIREVHRLLRESETKAHGRMDGIAKQLDYQTGILEGIRDTLRESKKHL